MVQAWLEEEENKKAIELFFLPINPAIIIRTNGILPGWKKSTFASLNLPPVSN
jgi:hypothetical protein